MKNALVILIGLAVAGTAGYEVYRVVNRFDPTVMEEILSEPSAFSSLTPQQVQDTAPTPPWVQGTAPTPPWVQGTAPTPPWVQGTAASAGGEYTDYQSGVIGNGQRVLLYFRSSSDGSSVQSDRELISLYSAGKASIATYRVDYDSAFPFLRAYGVTAPNTFVLLDGNGDIERSVTDPAPEVLEALVR